MHRRSVMACVKTKVFHNHKTQAVRLPKAVELPESVKEVEITAVGNCRIIAPVEASWDEWFEGPAVSEDFLADRDQPEMQEREFF